MGVATTKSLPVLFSMSLFSAQLSRLNTRTSLLLRAVVFLLVTAILHGCGSTGARIPDADTAYSDAQRFEDLASIASGEQRAVYQFSAAEAWYLALEVERAMFTLANIDTAFLPADQLIDYSLLFAEILQLQGRHQDALAALQEPLAQSRFFQARAQKQAAWGERTGNIHLVLGEYDQAVRFFDYALSAGTEDAILERLRTSLWRSLTLAETLPEPPFSSAELPGWISLAEISNITAGTLDEQLEQYQRWRFDNFGHPADIQPPESIRVLESLASEPAPRVALVLPLSGNLAPAGNAVLDGYLASLMENKGRDPLNPTDVLIFDSNSQSISAILREIRAQQVQLVIGPLEKSNVSAFVTLADPSLRTLVLNSPDTGAITANKSILSIALDIEDEARQAATAAMRDGYRTALALVPNNSSGDRASDAFQALWEEQNAELVGTDRFGSSDTYAGLLESRLHVDQSNSRMRQLRTLLAQNLEFSPRRRADIDAIFLSATAEEARQMKPMLAFFFADNIPVYSTSNIYDGSEDRGENQDLDGIKFSTLPWMIAETNVLSSLKSASPKTGGLLKLQAMGVDAYYLSQRVPQFLNAENTVYHGVLGKLSLEPGSRNLDRQQVWAEFVDGGVEPIALTVEADEPE